LPPQQNLQIEQEIEDKNVLKFVSRTLKKKFSKRDNNGWYGRSRRYKWEQETRWRLDRKKERKKFIINKLLPNYNISSKNRRSKVNSLSLVWFDNKGSETRLSAQPGLFTIFVTGVDKILRKAQAGGVQCVGWKFGAWRLRMIW
jgi:hypothetical protein